MEIRKIVKIVEETRMEMGKPVNPPTRRAAAVAVIKNPFAGKYQENLEELINIGEELGGMLGKIALEALGIPPEKAESYGKACIVGPHGRAGACRGNYASKTWGTLQGRSWRRKSHNPIREEDWRTRYLRLMFLCIIRMPLLFARTSTQCRCEFRTLPGAMR